MAAMAPFISKSFLHLPFISISLKRQQKNKHSISDVIWPAQSTVGLLQNLIWSQQLSFSKRKLCGHYQTHYHNVHCGKQKFQIIFTWVVSKECLPNLVVKLTVLTKMQDHLSLLNSYHFGLGLPQSFNRFKIWFWRWSY